MDRPGRDQETVITTGGALHVEVDRAPVASGAPVLLVSGADSPSSRWRPRLVAGLNAAGHDVVRYDHRDIGRSAPAAASYDLHDLTDDALRVIEAVGADVVHVVGSSMGGMIGQLLALDRPDRVLSLTALVSSPDPVGGRLSPPTDDYTAAVSELIFAPPPVDDADRVERLVAGARLLAGTRYAFDEDFVREEAAAAVAAGWRLESGHLDAVVATPPWYERLAGISCGVLVVAGGADPLFGPDHAEAFAAAVPSARVRIVDGLGHEVPDGLIAELLPDLVDHLVAAVTAVAPASPHEAAPDGPVSRAGRPACGS